MWRRIPWLGVPCPIREAAEDANFSNCDTIGRTRYSASAVRPSDQQGRPGRRTAKLNARRSFWPCRDRIGVLSSSELHVPQLNQLAEDRRPPGPCRTIFSPRYEGAPDSRLADQGHSRICDTAVVSRMGRKLFELRHRTNSRPAAMGTAQKRQLFQVLSAVLSVEKAALVWQCIPAAHTEHNFA